MKNSPLCPTPQSRDAAIQWFRHVKQDSDFDGVRDAKALAQLDEPERMQWQQFWQAVDAALKKCRHPSDLGMLRKVHPCHGVLAQLRYRAGENHDHINPRAG